MVRSGGALEGSRMNVGRVKNERWKESKIYVGRVQDLRWKGQTSTLEESNIYVGRETNK